MPLLRYLKQVVDELGKDKAGTLSAALSYTAIFAIAPMLLLVISITGFFFGDKAVSGQLFSQIQTAVGPSAAKTIQDAIIHTHNSQHSFLAFALGLFGTLLAAAALTGQLRSAFDVIFSVVPDPAAGIWQNIYAKVKNAVVLILGSLVVVISMLASALITGLGNSLQDSLGVPEATLQIINIGASLAVFVLMLYLIYRVLPDVRLPRKVVFYASVVIALLFLLGKVVLGVIIGRNGTASAYGAAASLITLLLWFYYSGQILFIGSEGIKVYLNNRDHIYKSKRFTLNQKTINITSKDNLKGRSADGFARGFRKNARTKKK